MASTGVDGIALDRDVDGVLGFFGRRVSETWWRSDFRFWFGRLHDARVLRLQRDMWEYGMHRDTYGMRVKLLIIIEHRRGVWCRDHMGMVSPDWERELLVCNICLRHDACVLCIRSFGESFICLDLDFDSGKANWFQDWILCSGNKLCIPRSGCVIREPRAGDPNAKNIGCIRNQI